MTINTITDSRLQNAVLPWLATLPGVVVQNIEPIKGDASFRRYFRLRTAEGSFILMDAPPEKESCDTFFQLAQQLSAIKVQVPVIYHADCQQGLLLLSDFGDVQLLGALTNANVDVFYRQALRQLLPINGQLAASNLPKFTQQLYWLEFERTEQWCLQAYFKLNLTAAELNVLQTGYQILIDVALSQPQVFVHRDYHARNLMVLTDHSLGILDFQDAVLGPVTYDLVSLLKDCYIDWPREQVIQWVQYYFDLLQAAGKLLGVSFTQFLRWFDLVGLQRHFKCWGIFTRCELAFNKPGYLQYMPRLNRYMQEVLELYPELHAFKNLIISWDLPCVP